MKVRLLYEGKSAQTAAPAANGSLNTPESVASPLSQPNTFQDIKKNVMAKMRRKNHFGVFAGVILAVSFAIWIGVKQVRRKNQEDEEEW